jgi:hypothetical protein
MALSKKKVPAKFEGDWTDINGTDLTWDDIITEINLARLMVANYDALLRKHKIPFKECDAASWNAKKTIYGWGKTEKPTKEVEDQPAPVVKSKNKKKRKK